MFVKGFPHSPLSEETTILGLLLNSIKTGVIALSEPYTQTQFIIFFSLQEDSLAQQRKDEREALIQLVLQKHLYS